VFRETVRRAPTLEPAVLVIQFRSPRSGATAGRTLPFAASASCTRRCSPVSRDFARSCGADDVTTGVYRGIYEWDGAEAARAHAIRMVGLLAPFSNADTARFHVVGRLRRDTFLCDPRAAPSDGADGWWRIEPPVEAAQPA
jgi:hypothetical protein